MEEDQLQKVNKTHLYKKVDSKATLLPGDAFNSINSDCGFHGINTMLSISGGVRRDLDASWLTKGEELHWHLLVAFISISSKLKIT